MKYDTTGIVILLAAFVAGFIWTPGVGIYTAITGAVIAIVEAGKGK